VTTRAGLKGRRFFLRITNACPIALHGTRDRHPDELTVLGTTWLGRVLAKKLLASRQAAA